MVKILLVGLIGLVVAGLIASLAIPVFAHRAGGGEDVPASQEAWEAMHETCEDGDWETMVEAADEMHGEDFSHMPGHGDSCYPPQEGTQPSVEGWGGMGGHMGGGMMTW